MIVESELMTRLFGTARLFGTDGIRGLANVDPVSPELALSLGRAAVEVLAPTHHDHRKPMVVVGRDTRLSGTMLEGALTAGLCSAGADVMSVGVLPTAGVAYLTRTMGAMAGIMISASHNAYEDNGIKFFSGSGYKLEDEREDAMGELLTRAGSAERLTGDRLGQCVTEAGATLCRLFRLDIRRVVIHKFTGWSRLCTRCGIVCCP